MPTIYRNSIACQSESDTDTTVQHKDDQELHTYTTNCSTKAKSTRRKFPIRLTAQPRSKPQYSLSLGSARDRKKSVNQDSNPGPLNDEANKLLTNQINRSSSEPPPRAENRVLHRTNLFSDRLCPTNNNIINDPLINSPPIQTSLRSTELISSSLTSTGSRHVSGESESGYSPKGTCNRHHQLAISGATALCFRRF